MYQGALDYLDRCQRGRHEAEVQHAARLADGPAGAQDAGIVLHQTFYPPGLLPIALISSGVCNESGGWSSCAAGLPGPRCCGCDEPGALLFGFRHCEAAQGA